MQHYHYQHFLRASVWVGTYSKQLRTQIHTSSPFWKKGIDDVDTNTWCQKGKIEKWWSEKESLVRNHMIEGRFEHSIFEEHFRKDILYEDYFITVSGKKAAGLSFKIIKYFWDVKLVNCSATFCPRIIGAERNNWKTRLQEGREETHHIPDQMILITEQQSSLRLCPFISFRWKSSVIVSFDEQKRIAKYVDALKHDYLSEGSSNLIPCLGLQLIHRRLKSFHGAIVAKLSNVFY
mmetsp:Transcript_18739/g.24742  ORF Transcript_18739/g.24742 Transcript_18739/m.24742 type:complete len:235 (+) Transcript_18739:64-768(+)